MSALAQRIPNPGITEQNFARGKDKTITWKVHRHICGPHINVYGFKMGPHHRRRIGQSAMSERVGRKQVAEVIRAGRHRNRAYGEHGDA